MGTKNRQAVGAEEDPTADPWPGWPQGLRLASAGQRGPGGLQGHRPRGRLSGGLQGTKVKVLTVLCD